MGTGGSARAVVLAGAMLAGLTVHGPALAAEALAQIEVRSTGDEGVLAISGRVLATAGATVSGELVVRREGSAGVVTTRSARDFVLAAGSTGQIGELKVSFTPSDRLEVVATVYRDGIAISRATVSTSDPATAEMQGGIN